MTLELKLEPSEHYLNVGQDILDSLERYYNNKIMPGGFLTAVLSNDLREACGRADWRNAQILPEIVGYIYNYFPSNAWGSREAVDAFISEGKI